MAKISRNARCPKCGLKNKHCQCGSISNKQSFSWGLIAVIALLLVVAIAALSITKDGNNKPSKRSSAAAKSIGPGAKKFRSVFHNYFKEIVKKDEWWLEHNLVSGGNNPQATMDVLKKTAEIKKRIERIVEKYKGTSEIASDIADNFKSFAVSVSAGGRATHYLKMGEPGANAQEIMEAFQNSLEICFVAKHDMSKAGMKSSLLFSQEISAVRIAAIEWHADPFFAGILMHELGHALYFRVLQKPSSTAQSGSRAYVDEEVAMHLMEMDVFDAATDHKFLSYIDSLVDRTGKVDDFDSLVGSITSDDIHALSTLLGCNGQCTAEEVNILFASIVISVGFRYAQAYAADPREEMIKFYKYCTSTLSRSH